MSAPAPTTNGRPTARADCPQLLSIPGEKLPHRHNAGRVLLRAFREFAAAPLAVIAGFAVLAAISILGDQAHIHGLDAVRRTLSHIIGKQASTTTLQAIATGLITVTSITFSVLLLAVQQTASNLSPVVFDQFVRRRSNQVFLGFFVGLALYAYVVMAVVQDDTPPIIGAFLATLLTVISMLLLLALVYSSIDQMRPTNVIRQIHDRVLVARRREGQLVCRTRREPESSAPLRLALRSSVTGYVTDIDVSALAAAITAVDGGEIRLAVTIGQYVAYGDDLASVAAAEEVDDSDIQRAVMAAVVVSRQRNLDHDATTGIDELANIAWTTGSTSKHSPEVSREAMYALRDLATRLIDADPAAEAVGSENPLPVVYRDNDLERVFEVLFSLIVVAHESHQHMQAARVLETYRRLIDRTSGSQRERLLRDLDHVRPLVEELPMSPMLQQAIDGLPRRLSGDMRR
jgi:uncharacterized membrane protein